uniref:Growth arrest and DNA damage-inducible protein GADD45 alpha n=1 Tax=Canis lupus familiaris TaxID=9615 RepID=A0A8P0SR92_CANLF
MAVRMQMRRVVIGCGRPHKGGEGAFVPVAAAAAAAGAGAGRSGAADGRTDGLTDAVQTPGAARPQRPEQPARRALGRTRGCNMTLEEFSAAEQKSESDPDNVVLCLLAADEDDDRDVALQIHFTLIQAFCCENDIDILRVSNPGRLAELLLLEPHAGPASEGAEQPPDLHCVLVTNPHSSQWKDPALSQLICFCRESRYMDQWVPVINLPER